MKTLNNFSAAAKGFAEAISSNNSVLFLMTALIILSLVLCAFLIHFITKYKKLKNEHYDNLYTDPITGIGNQEYFNHSFSSKITDSIRPVCFSYYIGFDAKLIKSAHGSTEYINIMKYTSVTIKANTSDKDILAVADSGAFSVIHCAKDRNEAEEWARKLLQNLSMYGVEFNSSANPHFYCGIYSIKAEDRDPERVSYNALQGYIKAFKTNVPIVFADDIVTLTDKAHEKYKKAISSGLRNYEFKLFLQLIVDAKTGKFVSAEILSRWQNPEKGLLPVSEYLDLIYQIDMIEDFDLYMLKQSFILLEDLKKSGLEDFVLSCNLTRVTMSDKGFADKLINLLSGFTFDHSNLILEIKEEALTQDEKAARYNLNICKNIGFRIAVDDFGTGYTSCVSLCSFPIDIVKIDRKVMLYALEPKGRKVLNGIVALSHSIGLETVCEGIEDEKLDAVAKESGCDYIQGYLYSRPYPAKIAKNMLIESLNS